MQRTFKTIFKKKFKGDRASEVICQEIFLFSVFGLPVYSSLLMKSSLMIFILDPE